MYATFRPTQDACLTTNHHPLVNLHGIDPSKVQGPSKSHPGPLDSLRSCEWWASTIRTHPSRWGRSRHGHDRGGVGWGLGLAGWK